MNWLERLWERVTHYHELRSQIELLQKRLEQRGKENEELLSRLRLAEEAFRTGESAATERLKVLEEDRSELFARLDQLQQEFSETTERLEYSPRLTALEQEQSRLAALLRDDARLLVLEKDRTTQLSRIDTLQKRMEELAELFEDNTRIAVLEQDRRELFSRIDAFQKRMEELSDLFEDDSRIAVLEQDRKDLFARVDALQTQLQRVCEDVENSPRLAILENDRSELFTRYNALNEMIASFQKTVEQLNHISADDVISSSLLPIVVCENDSEYDERIIPINQFLTKNGLAISMHLTSVEEQLDEIVYKTADIIRTSTFALIADEIKRKNLTGQAAELGVAEGKFSAVINALLPEKKLYLFDTFEGFPNNDLAYEKEFGYSNQQEGTYSGIDIDTILRRMKFPQNCIVYKGYFPETAEELEETFCFVSIDCDLYKPIYAGLCYFYPRLVKNGYIFVHDYRSKYYRGVREALTRFAKEFDISYSVLPDNTGTAIIVK